MRELADVEPTPETIEDILRFGLQEIGMLATGDHREPCYKGLLNIKEYAQRILVAAEDAQSDKAGWKAGFGPE